MYHLPEPLLSPSMAPAPTTTTTTPYHTTEEETLKENEIDQFLLTALNNPRDRLTLLKLDEELHSFLQDPRRTRLDFPHNSSYQRLIIHRVAQYFKLDHIVVDVEVGKRAVVLFKNAESRIPIIRFADLIEQPSDAVAPRSVKIMRRSALGSSSASQGEDTRKQAQAAAEERSLEKREEEYAKARARIFGTTTSHETSTEPSTVEENKAQVDPHPTNHREEPSNRSSHEGSSDRMWARISDFNNGKEIPEFYPRTLIGKGTEPAYSNQYPMIWGDSSPLYKNYIPPPGSFPPVESHSKPTPLHFPQNTNGVDVMSPQQNFRTPSPPIPPGYFRSPPPLIYTFPNEDVWSFYSGTTFSRGPTPTDSFHYPYERRPPRSTNLFDPHAPEKEKSKQSGLETSSVVPRSPSHESFFQNSQSIFHGKGNSAMDQTLVTPSSAGRQKACPASEIGHILEFNKLSPGTSATEDFLLQARQSGAAIKWLDNSKALAIYKTANAAQIALAKFSSSSFSVQPWKVIGIEK